MSIARADGNPELIPGPFVQAGWSSAQQMHQQQLVLEMVQGEMMQAREPEHRRTLETYLTEATRTMWASRVDAARSRLQPPPPRSHNPGVLLMNAPYSLPTQLVGRRDALQILEDWRLNMARVPLLSLTGDVGVGKSALAWGWIEQMRQNGQSPPLIVWWRLEHRHGDVLELVAMLLRHFGDDVKRYRTPNVMIQRLLHHLRRTRVLLIFDAAETLLYGQREGEEMVTDNRLRHWATPEIKQLFAGLSNPSSTAAKTLVVSRVLPETLHKRDDVFRLRLPGLDALSAVSMIKEKRTLLETTVLTRLAALLDGHPLSLNLLSGYLSGVNDTPLVQAGKVLEQLEPLLMAGRWHTIMQQAVSHLSNDARRLLGRLARDEGTVTLPALQAYEEFLREEGAPDMPQKLELALDMLIQRRLVQSSLKDGALVYDMHEAVRHFVRGQQNGMGQDSRYLPLELSPDQLVQSRRALEPTEAVFQRKAMAGHLEDAYQFFRSQLAESLSSQPGNSEREAKHLRMFLSRDDKKSVVLANPRDRAWVFNRLAACSLQAARPSRGLELYEQGNLLYEQAGEMESLAAGLIGMARCQMLLGQLQAADASLRQSLDISFQYGLQEQVALSHSWLGLLQALIGEWNQSATSLDDALMTARRLQDYMLEGEAWLKSSRSLLIRGWHVTALNGLEEVQRCLLMVPPDGVQVAHLWTEYHWLAGWANLDAGKLEQAQAHLEEANMRAVRFQNRLIMPSISFARARLSMTLSMRMELEPLVSAVETLRQDAWAQLSEAQAQAIEQGTPLMRADIHCFLGMLAKDAGQEKMPKQHARRAYDYAQGGSPRYAYFRAVRCAQQIDPSLADATVTERERASGANETSEKALLAA